MDRYQVTYLSYITAVENIPSILDRGILSHNLAQQLPHESVADPEVQALREMRVLPNGRALHDHANLYFWPRNAMMYRVRERRNLCILRVSADVLDLPEVFYSNQNASTYEAEFHPCNGDFVHLDRHTIYSGSWYVDGQRDNVKMQAMQAEVLIPDRVDPVFIKEVFVRTLDSVPVVRALARDLDVVERRGLFFDE